VDASKVTVTGVQAIQDSARRLSQVANASQVATKVQVDYTLHADTLDEIEQAVATMNAAETTAIASKVSDELSAAGLAYGVDVLQRVPAKVTPQTETTTTTDVLGEVNSALRPWWSRVFWSMVIFGIGS
jgi:urease alpha subunit